MSHSCDYVANKVHFFFKKGQNLDELYFMNIHILIKPQAYKRSYVNRMSHGIRMTKYETCKSDS